MQISTNKRARRMLTQQLVQRCEIMQAHQHSQRNELKGWPCIPSAMVSSHYHMCQVTGKAQICLWHKQRGRFLRRLTTYALELSGRVCHLGTYMLPFQIYAHAKTKEDQTATGIQKDFVNTMFHTNVSLHSTLYIILTLIYCIHYLAFYYPLVVRR